MISSRFVNTFGFRFLMPRASIISSLRINKHENCCLAHFKIIDNGFLKSVQGRRYADAAHVLHRTQESFISRVQAARNLDEVFSVVGDYQGNISNEELQKIFMLLQLKTPKQKSFKDDQVNQDHPGFLRLCEEIKSKAAMLPTLSLHSAVYFICKHGEESRMTRSVAESLRKPLLNLGWEGVSLALVCATKSKKNVPFVNNIKSILKMDLEKKLLAALDSGESFNELEAYALTCEWNLSEVLQQRLATLASKRVKYMTPKQAVVVMVGLAKRSEALTESHLLLWKAALKRVLAHFPSLFPGAVSGICFEWNENVKNKIRSPLHLPDEFCAAAARRAVNEKWSWRLCRTLVKTFTKVGFVDEHFLDYCVDKEMSSSQRRGDVVDLKVFSDLNFKPRHFESYFKQFESKFLAEGNIAYSLARCAVLGYYPLQHIEQLFGDSSRMATLLNRTEKYFGELHCLELLQQAVKVECPGYDGPLPPEELSVVYRRKMSETLGRSPLERYIVEAVGGQSYVAGQLWPKVGYRIAHLLVRDSAGSLVPFNSFTGEIRDLEGLQIPQEHQKIAVQLYQDRAFLSDGRSLRGFAALENRVTEQLGFKMVTINMDRFKSLPEEEKIPFLAKEIGLNG